MLCSIKLVLMLYYSILYKIAHRPYILEYIALVFFFSLSLTLPSICNLFVIASQLTIKLVFLFFCLFMYAKKYSVATMIWSIYHIVTSSLDLDNMKHDSWTVTHKHLQITMQTSYYYYLKKRKKISYQKHKIEYAKPHLWV